MEHESPSLLTRFTDADAQKGRSGRPDSECELDEAAPAIRRNWSHAVASAMQPVVAEILDVDGETFAEPFRRLADRTPAPVTALERHELKARFMEFALRLGSDFHSRFHRKTPMTCRFLPVESTARIWFDSVTDPRRLLTVWAATYGEEFARHHPLPLEWKAARALRQRFAQSADIQGIAVAIGTSRAVLVRHFERAFGMTPRAYHARGRLAYALTELRNRETKVEDAARLAGFASVKNFNRAVNSYTALTPSQIRRLPSAEFERLLQNELQTDPLVLAATLARNSGQARRVNSGTA
jgi:AraC-like DNA-binding protein